MYALCFSMLRINVCAFSPPGCVAPGLLPAWFWCGSLRAVRRAPKQHPRDASTRFRAVAVAGGRSPPSAPPSMLSSPRLIPHSPGGPWLLRRPAFSLSGRPPPPGSAVAPAVAPARAPTVPAGVGRTFARGGTGLLPGNGSQRSGLVPDPTGLIPLAPPRCPLPRRSRLVFAPRSALASARECCQSNGGSPGGPLDCLVTCKPMYHPGSLYDRPRPRLLPGRGRAGTSPQQPTGAGRSAPHPGRSAPTRPRGCRHDAATWLISLDARQPLWGAKRPPQVPRLTCH